MKPVNPKDVPKPDTASRAPSETSISQKKVSSKRSASAEASAPPRAQVSSAPETTKMQKARKIGGDLFASNTSLDAVTRARAQPRESKGKEEKASESKSSIQGKSRNHSP